MATAAAASAERLNSHTTMAKSEIENTMDSNAIGVVVQCRCSACGGCGMLPGTEPDDDVMNTPCPQCNPWAKAKTSTHEPAIAVHNVFSEAIPGAFGVGFLRRLIGEPNACLSHGDESAR